MTAVAGLIRNGIAYIGADTRLSNNAGIYNDGAVKVWSKEVCGVKWIFGASGNHRTIESLWDMDPRFTKDILHENDDPWKYARQVWNPAIYEYFQKSDALVLKDGRRNMDASFMVGVRDKLFMFVDFTMIPVTCGYEGMGQGEGVVWGYLNARYHEQEIAPHDLIRGALKAASSRYTSCGPEAIVLSTAD